MAFARLLRNLLRDEGIGPRVVPIIPDEARTFGMDALFQRGQDLRRARASSTSRSTPSCCCPTPRAKDGQILEEGITEAGVDGRASPPPAPSYATWGVPMIPFFIFYSMFGFQRVGDLIWACGDSAGRGLPARRHRRPHDAARRGPAARGRPQPGAGLDGAQRAGLRPGLRLRDGGHRPGRHRPHVRRRAEDVFYYLTLYNENYVMPARARRASTDEGILEGLYRWAAAPEGLDPARHHPVLRIGRRPPPARPSGCWPSTTTSAPSSGRPRPTRRCARTPSPSSGWNRLHPDLEPRGGTVRHRAARRRARARSWPSPTS